MSKRKQYYIISYLLMFLIIYLTDGGYTNFTSWGYYAKIIVPIVLLAMLLITDISVIHSFDTYFFVAIVIIAFTSLLHSSSTGVTVGFIATLLSGYLITRRIDFVDFTEVFLRTVRVVAICSILLFLIVWKIPVLIKYLPIATYSYNLESSVQYYEVIVAHTPVSIWQVVRNYGPVWEPGVYQIYINLALLISIFNSSRKMLVFDIILFGLTIVSTFSTTGYIAYCACLMCIPFTETQARTTKIKIVFGLLLIVLSVGYIFREELFNIVFFKLFGEGRKTGSYLSRTASIWGNLRIAMTHPLLGVGYSRTKDLLNSMYGVGNIHQTNTLLNYLASFGIIAGSYFCCLCFRFARKLSNNAESTVICSFAIVIMLSGENMIASLCLTTLLFYGRKVVLLQDGSENDL